MALKQGDRVRYKDGDTREFIVHTIYKNGFISLGLYDYPDTEQDNMVEGSKLELARLGLV